MLRSNKGMKNLTIQWWSGKNPLEVSCFCNNILCDYYKLSCLYSSKSLGMRHFFVLLVSHFVMALVMTN